MVLRERQRERERERERVKLELSFTHLLLYYGVLQLDEGVYNYVRERKKITRVFE